jgi:hypothetical protein
MVDLFPSLGYSLTVLRIILPVFLFGILTGQALHFVPSVASHCGIASRLLLLDELLYFSWGW